MGGNGNQYYITGENGSAFLYYENEIGMGIQPWE